MPTLRLPTRSPALPTGHLPEHHPPGQSPLVLSYHGPREKEPSFTDGRFDALASYVALRECLNKWRRRQDLCCGRLFESHVIHLKVSLLMSRIWKILSLVPHRLKP